MKQWLMALPVVAMALGGSTACATKTFVRTSVGEVNEKVDGLSKAVEENQQRIAKNEESINQVDRKADAANQSAADARQAANTAKSAADAAATRADGASARADGASAQAAAIDKASKRIVFEVTLSENQGGFVFGKKELPDETKGQIDALVSRLLQNPNGAWLEIEGHTDDRGDKMFNDKLGLERAESVKRYLYETHKIPLHKMNVISYGEDRPVGDNKTRDGRAMNRRVVIRVLT
jgi:outer membrane protein OmpA-like peptidoglycan-associated protein